MTTITRTSAFDRVCTTSVIASRTNSVRSRAILYLSPGGKRGASSSIVAFTPSMNATALAPGV